MNSISTNCAAMLKDQESTKHALKQTCEILERAGLLPKPVEPEQPKPKPVKYGKPKGKALRTLKPRNVARAMMRQLSKEINEM